MASYLFVQLCKGKSKFTIHNLSLLKKMELKALAHLMNSPVSGNIATLTNRLVDVYDLRKQLGFYDEDPQELVNDFKRKELHEMCKRAKIWRSGNKYALAVSLLRWRNRCRRDGQRTFRESMAALKNSPRQMRLIK